MHHKDQPFLNNGLTVQLMPPKFQYCNAPWCNRGNIHSSMKSWQPDCCQSILKSNWWATEVNMLSNYCEHLLHEYKKQGAWHDNYNILGSGRHLKTWCWLNCVWILEQCIMLDVNNTWMLKSRGSYHFLPYNIASAGISCYCISVYLCVCHMPVLYQNSYSCMEFYRVMP